MQKLELTWVGKEKRARLEPRVLVESLNFPITPRRGIAMGKTYMARTTGVRGRIPRFIGVEALRSGAERGCHVVHGEAVFAEDNAGIGHRLRKAAQDEHAISCQFAKILRRGSAGAAETAIACVIARNG